MCGILGSIGYDFSQSEFIKGLNALDRRGPDFSNAVFDDLSGQRVCLGHTRLSIIDLDERSNQPMISECGKYSLSYNGEIYNYVELRSELQAIGIQFKSTSDTEVLLNGLRIYGAEYVKKLRGMFAFALIDKDDGTVLLGRDHFGIKPLYYSIADHKLLFASTFDPILNLVEVKLNREQIVRYLVNNNNLNDGETIYQDIKQVLPGELILFEARSGSGIHQVKNEKYWDLRRIQKQSVTFEEARLHVRELFLSSVAMHMRSDVPVCATLSGGIDSSSIVCAMRHLSPDLPLHTFSYISANQKSDETKWIDIVNSYVSAIPHKVSANLDLTTLKQMLDAQQEPVGSTSIYAQFLVMKAIRDAGYRVTLDGQGADEFLAGYDTYLPKFAVSQLFKGKIVDALSIVRALSKSGRLSYFNFMKLLGGMILRGPIREVLRSKLAKLPDYKHINEEYTQHFASSAPKAFRDLLHYTLLNSSLPTLLRYADRNSMFFSVEGRVPFLNVELVEYIASLPDEFIISRDGRTKFIFREAMRGIVPNEILDRVDKIGFETPELVWLTENYEYFSEKCLGYDNDLVVGSEVINHLDNVIKHEQSYSFAIWRALNFILFRIIK